MCKKLRSLIYLILAVLIVISGGQSWAKPLFIITHQNPSMWKGTQRLLNSPALSNATSLGLYSDEFPLSDVLIQTLDALQVSKYGEVQLPFDPSEVHMVGGYSRLCFSETLNTVVRQANQKKPKAVQIFLYADLIYTTPYAKPLASRLKKYLPLDLQSKVLSKGENLNGHYVHGERSQVSLGRAIGSLFRAKIFSSQYRIEETPGRILVKFSAVRGVQPTLIFFKNKI